MVYIEASCTRCSSRNLCSLPIQCTCSCISYDLTVKSYYFPEQHKAFVTFNGGPQVFTVRYERNLYILLRYCGAMSWLSRLVVGLSSRGPRLNSSFIDVRFLVGKVALGWVFLRVLPFFSVRIILPVLQTHTHLQGAVTVSIAPPPSPPNKAKFKIHRFCRHGDMKGLTRFKLHPKLATETG